LHLQLPSLFFILDAAANDVTVAHDVHVAAGVGDVVVTAIAVVGVVVAADVVALFAARVVGLKKL